MQHILYKINRINIELSNICNYSRQHNKCPVHLESSPQILPTTIVKKVIDYFSDNNYEGKIAFHLYNEPGIDPRLFKFIEYARQKCPKSHISFVTNGFYLDEGLLEEYHNIGLTEIIITAYTDAEYKRFSSYKTAMKVTINRYELDDRLCIYDIDEKNLSKQCLAPFNELIITRDAKVGLCCWDWRKDHTFGNLFDQSLGEILMSKEIMRVYQELSIGRRNLHLCRRCDRSR